MITICSAFVILIFYAPKSLVVWAEMGIELNLLQRLVVQSVDLAQRGGLPIAALLFIGFISALVWGSTVQLNVNRLRTNMLVLGTSYLTPRPTALGSKYGIV